MLASLLGQIGTLGPSDNVMAAAQTAWFAGLCSSVREMTAAVATSRAQSAGTDVTLVPAMHLRLDAYLKAISAGKSLFRGQEHPRSKSDFSMYVKDFAELLTALVPQLSRLGAGLSSWTLCSIGSTDEQLFWEHWSFLTNACSTYNEMNTRYINLWPEDQHPFHSILSAAFYPILTWLLPVTRSSAWTSMRQQHGLKSRNHELAVLLSTLNKFLLRLARSPPAMLATHLPTIPPTYLPLLCCIITEQFGTAPLLVRTTHQAGTDMLATTYKNGLQVDYPDFPVLHILLGSVTLCINHMVFASAQAPAHNEGFACLTTPAVLQLLKMVIILPPEKPPLSEPLLLRRSISCLAVLLSQGTQRARFSPGAASIRDRASIRDAVGLPQHMNALLSSEALETDTLVLHAICRHICVDAQLTTCSLQVQWQLMERWHYDFKHHLAYGTPAARATMTTSMVGLAKQCTEHGLQIMQQLQGASTNQAASSTGGRRMAPLRDFGSQRGLQQQLPRSKMSSATKIPALAQAGMLEARSLVFAASQFPLLFADGSSPKGESLMCLPAVHGGLMCNGASAREVCLYLCSVQRSTNTSWMLHS